MKQSPLSWIKFAWNDEIFLSLWLFLFSIALVVLTIWATFLGERINHNNLGAIYYNMLLSRFDSQIQIAEIEVALLKDKSIETPNFIINKTYNTYLDFINTDISAPNFRIAPEQTVIKKQVNSFEELKVLIDKNILATRATEFDQLQL